MKRTRRSFIQAAAVSTVLATGTVAASGCGTSDEEGCNKFDTEEKFIDKFGGDDSPQPGENANDANDLAPKGHDKDMPENGAAAHDKDDEPPYEDSKGERVGHCKFDAHDNSEPPEGDD